MGGEGGSGGEGRGGERREELGANKGALLPPRRGIWGGSAGCEAWVDGGGTGGASVTEEEVYQREWRLK